MHVHKITEADHGRRARKRTPRARLRTPAATCALRVRDARGQER
jgi:hypothetical protein